MGNLTNVKDCEQIRELHKFLISIVNFLDSLFVPVRKYSHITYVLMDISIDVRNFLDVNLKYPELLVAILVCQIQISIISIYHNSRRWCHCCKKVHPLTFDVPWQNINWFLSGDFLSLHWLELGSQARGQSYHKTPSNSYLVTKEIRKLQMWQSKLYFSTSHFALGKVDFQSLDANELIERTLV